LLENLNDTDENIIVQNTHRNGQENLITEESNQDTSYLKTMSNDHDHDNEWPPVKPIFLPKIKPFSPKNLYNFPEIISKESPKFHIPKLQSSDEKEKPFNTYHCESIIENASNLSDFQFKCINSQVIDKLVSQKSSSLFYEKSECFSDASPKLEDFHSKPLEIEVECDGNDKAFTSKQHNLKKSMQKFTNFNMDAFFEPSIKNLIYQMRLNEFSAEQVVDAIFSNESLRKISFTIFKIKLEVILNHISNRLLISS